MNKYLNNIVEQDHKFGKIKANQMLGFRRFEAVNRTIPGIEIMNMKHNRQIEEIRDFLSEV